MVAKGPGLLEVALRQILAGETYECTNPEWAGQVIEYCRNAGVKVCRRWESRRSKCLIWKADSRTMMEQRKRGEGKPKRGHEGW